MASHTVPVSFVALLGGAHRSSAGRAKDPLEWLEGRLRTALLPGRASDLRVRSAAGGLSPRAVAWLRGVRERLASLPAPTGRGRPREATVDGLAAFLGVGTVSGDSFPDVVQRWVVDAVARLEEAFAPPARRVRGWLVDALDGCLTRLRAGIAFGWRRTDGTFASREEAREVEVEAWARSPEGKKEAFARRLRAAWDASDGGFDEFEGKKFFEWSHHLSSAQLARSWLD